MRDPNKKWTKEEILDMINTKDYPVKRGILCLYSLQDRDERTDKKSLLQNKVGFSKLDAPILTKYAKKLERGEELTTEEMNRGRYRLRKYAGQLTKVANKEL